MIDFLCDFPRIIGQDFITVTPAVFSFGFNGQPKAFYCCFPSLIFTFYPAGTDQECSPEVREALLLEGRGNIVRQRSGWVSLECIFLNSIGSGIQFLANPDTCSDRDKSGHD